MLSTFDESICLGETLNDYDTLSLGLWKNFRIISGYLWEVTFKNFKSSCYSLVNLWQSFRSCSRLSLWNTLKQMCIDTNESEVRGYRNLLTDHKVLFFICLMTDILKGLITLSLALQKQGALLVDISRQVLFPTNSFYAS